ncbi:hypothetical protein NDU88_002703 [Pleurodeles waltl]|uniref:Secreted protein n=1 Tax=Pleurodeles waltl TaxID=8319 RepID=A0AAV7P7I7_PLEWA|nr:hypothetical protein NDU88_002703 [Pleurodeles waltl]
MFALCTAHALAYMPYDRSRVASTSGLTASSKRGLPSSALVPVASAVCFASRAALNWGGGWVQASGIDGGHSTAAETLPSGTAYRCIVGTSPTRRNKPQARRPLCLSSSLHLLGPAPHKAL